MLKIFLAALALSGAATAWANEPPRGPITFVVPYQAGGALDTVVRTLADEMGRRLNQTIVVDNRTGGGGALGANAVARSAPDGRTVLVSLSSTLLNTPLLFPKVPYDPRDFALVSMLASAKGVLAVNAAVPANNVKELLAWAAQNKGKVSFGSVGVGSNSHMMGAYMSSTHQLDMVHIAYRGEASMIQDLIGGQVQWGIGSVGSMRSHFEQGRLRPLAIAASTRLAAMPEILTMREAGLPDAEYTIETLIVMLAPAKTPPAVLARLEKEARAAVHTTALKARFHVFGMEAIGSTSAEFQTYYKTAYPVVERLVRTSGAKAD